MTVRYAHLAPEHQLAAVERLCETSTDQNRAGDTTSDTGLVETVAKPAAALQ
jgi:hypothetical protein